jgi:hypothetical protein
MRTEEVVGMTEDLPLVTVCLWEATLSHGGARSKQLWLVLQQRQNTGQWRWVYVKCCG